MNQMMVSTHLRQAASGSTVEGEGYRKLGAITSVAGTADARLHPAGARPVPRQRRDGERRRRRRRRSDRGGARRPGSQARRRCGGDPAKPTRGSPRCPFDSDYKFMATFHTVHGRRGRPRDPAASRAVPTSCSPGAREAGGPHERRTGADLGCSRRDRRGERARWARRVCACSRSRPGSWPTTRCLDDGATRWRSRKDLGFVGMVGIIDPLRAEAKARSRRRSRAGIDVRMITGDHAVTAQAIGEHARARAWRDQRQPSCEVAVR